MIGIETKLGTVRERLRDAGRIVVAVSGGVDSGTLLALAVDTLGADAVLAVTGRSAAVPEADLDDARRVAAHLGVRHEIVDTREMEREAYVANRGDRCFHCRVELFGVLGALAAREGGMAVAYGAIVDDLGDDRPGMRAADERGVMAPLLDAGLTKIEIREIARRFDLPVRDKPAAACLASRIPVGTRVTAERLSRVDRAETALRALGLRQVRVRDHGEIGRVELDRHGLDRLGDARLRDQVAAAVRQAGFRYAAIDLEGYRTGSVAAVPSSRPAREGGQ